MLPQPKAWAAQGHHRWYRNLGGDDPLARATYDMLSRPQNYVFNRGWMGVFAAKLGDGDDAFRWARSLLEHNVCLFGDTCIGEIVYDFEDFKKTPEIAAHGALICNVTQMLVDPDDPEVVRVFPAVPRAWENEGVAFANLAANGGLRVSGSLEPGRVTVTLENRSGAPAERQLRVRLPEGTTGLRGLEPGVRIEHGWAIVPAVALASKQRVTYTLEPTASAGRRELRIPRPAKPWKEASMLVGDGKTLYSDFTLIQDRLNQWHCIGTFGKGADGAGNGYALSDGYTLFHAVGASLDAPMTLLDKIPCAIPSPQAFMWAPGAVWDRRRTTAYLFYFHYYGWDAGKQNLPEEVCCRVLTSSSPDLAAWHPYSGGELPETNMAFRERDDRDFCVFWDDRLGKYLMYYCCSGSYRGYAGLAGIVRVRTSSDLVHWSDPVTVMGPPPNDQHGYSESPFVLYRDGYYCLWVSGIDYSRTSLYISEDPFNFGDAILNRIEEQPGHAPEIVSEKGKDYMACSMVSTVPSASPAAHDLDGVLIQPLRWEKAGPAMEARVTRKR